MLIFVYEKEDTVKDQTTSLYIRHTVFIDRERTADFQTTKGLNDILSNQGNQEDVLAFFSERMLPLDDIQALALAEEVLVRPPQLGYLTVSNALQWRLQYSRAIHQAGQVDGIEAL